MKTASIFLKKKLEENTDHFLDNSQIHYLKKVLKIKAGESIYVYDGQGSKNSALFNGEDTIQIVKKDNQKRKFEVTALVPFLKRAQFEFQIQKMVEIGVKSIICYVSAKTKDKYNLDKELDKTKRYEEMVLYKKQGNYGEVLSPDHDKLTSDLYYSHVLVVNI